MNPYFFQAMLDDDSGPEYTPRTVVRVRDSFFHTNDRIVFQREIRYLKRKCTCEQVIEEDLSCMGASVVIPKITNFYEVKEGVYELVTCDTHYDWESGYPEDWDYKLIPYKEN